MNRLQKTLYIPAVVGTMIFLLSCGDNANTPNHDSMSHENEEGHVHTYACPMHPEVTGHEGETCPKCGMKLEHNDNAGNTNTYFMQFNGIPAAPKAGEDVVLSFIPKIKGKDAEQVPLDVEHEKKIHLIIVSNDLSWFEHIHPEYQADGSYQVKTKFPAGGDYTLFADYVPTGGNHQLEKIALTVTGEPAVN
ncbi:MAG TPA: heavy metal-binding domain-containing protein, partial [Bacteroidia bacterium]|nr:heavy metal-binding domain-containing protein [Bacteroidia bacterium]